MQLVLVLLGVLISAVLLLACGAFVHRHSTYPIVQRSPWLGLASALACIGLVLRHTVLLASVPDDHAHDAHSEDGDGNVVAPSRIPVLGLVFLVNSIPLSLGRAYRLYYVFQQSQRKADLDAYDVAQVRSFLRRRNRLSEQVSLRLLAVLNVVVVLPAAVAAALFAPPALALAIEAVAFPVLSVLSSIGTLLLLWNMHMPSDVFAIQREHLILGIIWLGLGVSAVVRHALARRLLPLSITVSSAACAHVVISVVWPVLLSLQNAAISANPNSRVLQRIGRWFPGAFRPKASGMTRSVSHNSGHWNDMDGQMQVMADPVCQDELKKFLISILAVELMLFLMELDHIAAVARGHARSNSLSAQSPTASSLLRGRRSSASGILTRPVMLFHRTASTASTISVAPAPSLASGASTSSIAPASPGSSASSASLASIAPVGVRRHSVGEAGGFFFRHASSTSAVSLMPSAPLRPESPLAPPSSRPSISAARSDSELSSTTLATSSTQSQSGVTVDLLGAPSSSRSTQFRSFLGRFHVRGTEVATFSNSSTLRCPSDLMVSRDAMQRTVDRYIRETGPLMLNLSSDVRKEIIASVDNSHQQFPLSVLEKARQQVWELLMTDVFPRFWADDVHGKKCLDYLRSSYT